MTLMSDECGRNRNKRFLSFNYKMWWYFLSWEGLKYVSYNWAIMWHDIIRRFFNFEIWRNLFLPIKVINLFSVSRSFVLFPFRRFSTPKAQKGRKKIIIIVFLAFFSNGQNNVRPSLNSWLFFPNRNAVQSSIRDLSSAAKKACKVKSEAKKRQETRVTD